MTETNRAAFTSLRLVPLLALSLGCGVSTATTLPPEDATAEPTDSTETEEVSAAPAPDTEVLEANHRDLQAMQAYEGQVDNEIDGYIAVIDQARASVDALVVLAQRAELSEAKLNEIVEKAVEDGNFDGAEAFSRKHRSDAEAHLEALHELAPQLEKVPQVVDDSIVRIERDRAEGEQTLRTIEGRSNAVGNTPLEQLHPDLAAQVGRARELNASLDATATASLEVLHDALTRSANLAEALGIEEMAVSVADASADVSEATTREVSSGS